MGNEPQTKVFDKYLAEKLQNSWSGIGDEGIQVFRPDFVV